MRTVGIETDLAKTVQRKRFHLTAPTIVSMGRDDPNVCLCGVAPKGFYPAG